MAHAQSDPRAMNRALAASIAMLCSAGLLAELGAYELGWPSGPVEFFSLSYERNLPTWFASSLLLLIAATLARSASLAATDRASWWGLAAIFAFMSLDEAVELHEHLGLLIEGHGVFYFSWIIPAACLLAFLAALGFRFVMRLEPVDRKRFVVAGSIYVGGALLMELPLGWWAERAGDDNLTYGLVDWVEETLELVGAALFLVALRARLARLSVAAS